MPRTRVLRPEFFLEDSLALCRPDARLLLIGLLTIADREGRLEDRPAAIKAAILPLDDDVGAGEIDGLLSELSKGGFLCRYRVAGKPFLAIKNFSKYTRPHSNERPSKMPSPEEGEPAC